MTDLNAAASASAATTAGLTTAEAAQRRQQGSGNTLVHAPERSYLYIIRKNLLTFVNIVLFIIAALLVTLSSPSDALTTAGLVTLNVIIGTAQEIRAKRKLDRITLLARPQALALRDGHEQPIAQEDIVLDDVLRLNAGDQVLCDGMLLSGYLEADESLLTGESDVVPKSAGDSLNSGSFVTAGSALYTVTHVGADNYAARLTAKARQFNPTLTPLQHEVNRIVRLVAFVCGVLGLLLLIYSFRTLLAPIERVQIAAVVMGTIPAGLIFLVTLSYALGALRIAGQGALVQQSNAVESLSNTTVLCMDKTGTLTTNEITLRTVVAHNGDTDQFKHLLGIFAASASSSNRTLDAVRASCPGSACIVDAEIPFTSALKWSALQFAAGEPYGTYILGAPEILRPHLTGENASLDQQAAAWSAQGLRVVLFAHTPEMVTLRDAANTPTLPTPLTPLGLVCLSDTLRPNIQQTLAHFQQANIRLKIISGDNPQTVKALAQQAGFDTSGGVLSGVDLATMDDAAFAAQARQAAIFGRITPDQKERLIDVLQASGEYVAMVGDGVNDVLSLKKAHVGIAMQSGSAAARGVADIVLLKDNFGVLPAAFLEGQRIVNGIADTMRLLLTRTVSVLLIIAGVGIVGGSFPFLPTQDALNALLAAGIPPLLLALWAQPGTRAQPLRADVARFVFPAALSITLVGIGVYVGYLTTANVIVARTALITVVVLCGCTLVLFTAPPIGFFAVLLPPRRDWRVTLIVPGTILLLAVVTLAEPLRAFFTLAPLATADYALLAGITLVWLLLLRLIFRWQLYERLLR